MFVSYSKENEELDAALLIARYAFQLLRFFLYVIKARQHIVNHTTNPEVALDNENNDEENGETLEPNNSGEYEMSDKISRKTNLIY